MARNKAKAKRAQANQPARAVFPAPVVVPAEEEGGRKPLWLWLLAAVLIVCGYSLLGKVDPYGQNIWAVLSPVLILAGYLAIIPAILLTFR
ncbi:MAG: hypothetical protein M0011_04230 [Elusimicrobia bacterium]|nr:hypothetical protein [Elusimicrobiota bacterium]